MIIRSGRRFNRGQQPDRVRFYELSLRLRNIEIMDRQAVGLLCLAYTKYTFDSLLTSVTCSVDQ